jgi:hypothetical protein
MLRRRNVKVVLHEALKGHGCNLDMRPMSMPGVKPLLFMCIVFSLAFSFQNNGKQQKRMSSKPSRYV